MAQALKVSSPTFCMASGIRKRGNMLPPMADMVRMMSVEIAPCCARVCETLASNMPNDATAKEVAAVMTMNPGRCGNRSRWKTAAPHRNMSVRCAVGFIQQTASGGAGGEQQEHDSDAGGVERDHGVLFFLAGDVAHIEGDASRGSPGPALRGRIFEHRQTRFDPSALLRRKPAAGLLEIPHAHPCHGVGQRSHCDLLQDSADHLGCHRVGTIVEQTDRGVIVARGIARPEGYGMRAESFGNNQRGGSVALFHRGFGAGRRVFRRNRLALFRFGVGARVERRFLKQSANQTFGDRAAIFVHHQYADAWRTAAHAAEDHAEDAKERDRQNERQNERAAIAAESAESVADDGGDHCRNSLPVSCRNTDSRLGRRRTTSITSRLSRMAASSSGPMSVGFSTEKCAMPSCIVPPRAAAQAAAFSTVEAKRISTSLRPPNDCSTSSSLVPCAMTWP